MALILLCPTIILELRAPQEVSRPTSAGEEERQGALETGMPLKGGEGTGVGTALDQQGRFPVEGLEVGPTCILGPLATGPLAMASFLLLQRVCTAYYGMWAVR